MVRGCNHENNVRVVWFLDATITAAVFGSCVFEYYGWWIQPHDSWNRGMSTLYWSRTKNRSRVHVCPKGGWIGALIHPPSTYVQTPRLSRFVCLFFSAVREDLSTSSQAKEKKKRLNGYLLCDNMIWLLLFLVVDQPRSENVDVGLGIHDRQAPIPGSAVRPFALPF